MRGRPWRRLVLSGVAFTCFAPLVTTATPAMACTGPAFTRAGQLDQSSSGGITTVKIKVTQCDGLVGEAGLRAWFVSTDGGVAFADNSQVYGMGYPSSKTDLRGGGFTNVLGEYSTTFPTPATTKTIEARACLYPEDGLIEGEPLFGRTCAPTNSVVVP